MRANRVLPATFAVLALSLAACAASPDGSDAGAPDAGVATVDCSGEPYSEAHMRHVIETLANPAWEGRKFDSEGLVAATRWTRDQFECLGLVPGAPALPGAPDDAFEQPFETDGDDIEPASDISGYVYDSEARFGFTNVIGSIPGAGALADEVVVLGAHLDHMGRYGKEDDQLVVGADDDATGILALLTLAKALRAEALPENRRTLVFVAWGIEEDPFYVRGSQAFFAALDAAGTEGRDRIVHYVNFDMIGAYADEGNLTVLGTFPAADDESHDAAPSRRIIDALASDHPDLELVLGYRGEASDHETFCTKGIPYAFFWTHDDCYHKPCDTPENLDYAHLAPTLRFASDVVRALLDDPSLVDDKAAFPDAFAIAYDGALCTDQGID